MPKLLLFLALLTSSLLAAKPQRDVQYDTKHQRNTLDFFPAKDQSKPAPVFIYFHGGGFRNGDKTQLEKNRRDTLDAHLNAGFAVISCNYPFLSKDIDYAKIATHCARAVQFIRSKSKDWNLNPKQLVCGGVSAGALISEFLAYHDDFADPKSPDPITHQSSRPAVVVSIMQPIGTDGFALRFMDKGEAPLFIYSNAKPNDRLHPPKQAQLIHDKAQTLGIPTALYSGGRNSLPQTPKDQNWLQLQIAFCKKHLPKAAPPSPKKRASKKTAH